MGLDQSNKTYSIIAVDAYRPPYIPSHLTTHEFFKMAKEHLTSDGVLVVNVGRSPTDRTLVNQISSTIQSVFPSTYLVDVPGSFNTMIYATNQPTSFDNLNENLDYLKNKVDTSELLVESIQVAQGNVKPTPSSSTVYTDDWSPIEWVTNSMVLRYVLYGDLEEIGH